MDAGRADLLRHLRRAGVPEDVLEQAAADGRLAALPIELELSRDCRFTIRDMLAETGHTEAFAVRNYRSLGLPVPGLDEPAIDEPELEAWRMLKLLLDAGLPEQEMHELSRTVGRAAAQMTETMIEVFARAFRREGDTEADFALRLAELVANLSFTIGPLTETPLRMHLRDRFRHAALRTATGTRPVAVAFADLVGFTPLAEAASAQDLSRVAGRLELLAADVARAPVRLIKLIGDAVMLVAPEPAPLVGAVASLVDRAAGDLPPLRAGLAAGEALHHGGDWYGPPVNLASRITAVAAPGEVLADARGAAPGFTWRPLGERRLKGIEAPVALHALERVASPTPFG